MSGLGHLAVGFAAKPLAPKVPLLVLLAAGEVNEIAYFAFTALGVEKAAQTTFDFTQGMRYLEPVTNPWSHGIFMSIVWALLAAGIGWLVYRESRSAVVIGLAVISHIVLDLIMHSNLPLFFDGSPLVGLGLENSGPGMIFMTALDLALVAGGLALYFTNRKKTVSQMKPAAG